MLKSESGTPIAAGQHMFSVPLYLFHYIANQIAIEVIWGSIYERM